MQHEKHDYGGMTVNERLYTAGLIDEFDAARERCDRQRMVELLEAVEVRHSAWSVDKILATD